MNHILINIKKNKANNGNLKIEEVLTIDTLINSVITSFYNYNKRKNNLKGLLLNLAFNNEKIVDKLDVTFSRKNKIYTKEIYIFMTNEMKNKVNNNNIK